MQGKIMSSYLAQRTLSFIVFILCFYSNIANANFYSSEQVLRFVNSIEPHDEKQLSVLVRKLTAPFNNDYNKAQAIAYWIASRIYYDHYLYNNGAQTKLRKDYKGQSAKQLIKSKMGICGDFANLFAEMCQKANVKAFTITGYAYPAYYSKKNDSGSFHAWNYFKYKRKKIYVDPAFMASGRVEVEGKGRSRDHRKAYRKLKKSSQINDINTFYFDFDYENEIKTRNYVHQELN